MSCCSILRLPVPPRLRCYPLDCLPQDRRYCLPQVLRYCRLLRTRRWERPTAYGRTDRRRCCSNPACTDQHLRKQRCSRCRFVVHNPEANRKVRYRWNRYCSNRSGKWSLDIFVCRISSLLSYYANKYLLHSLRSVYRRDNHYRQEHPQYKDCSCNNLHTQCCNLQCRYQSPLETRYYNDKDLHSRAHTCLANSMFADQHTRVLYSDTRTQYSLHWKL